MGDLKSIFEAYAKFGNPKADGKTITLTNADKWFKEANVIDGKTITTTDTGIEFKKLKSKAIDYKQFLQYIDGLAATKKIDAKTIKEKLARCAAPGTSGATQADKSSVVDRMTDTSKYTGTHKERFDAEGKGKGLEGRTDKTENTGYVAAYKNKDTYDKKQK